MGKHLRIACMEKRFLHFLMALLLLNMGCSNRKLMNENRQGNSQPDVVHNLLNEPTSQVKAIKQLKNERALLRERLTKEIREDYHSWTYTEPERWPYLSEKFADEVIQAYPEAAAHRDEMMKIFRNYLKRRKEAYYADPKKKLQMMSACNGEFKYNLSFLITPAGYEKWQELTKVNYQRFSSKRDSLKIINGN